MEFVSVAPFLAKAQPVWPIRHSNELIETTPLKN